MTATKKKRGIGGGAAVQAVTRWQPPSAAGNAIAGEAPAQTPGQAVDGLAGTGGIMAALGRADGAGASMQTVPLTEVAEHPDNPRRSLGDLTGLAESITAFGVLQPIIVVPADAFLAAHPQHRAGVGERRWVVLAGHRRRAAAEAAGHDSIPAMVRPDLAAEGQAAVAFVVENVHRENLAPLEEARAYALLADLGMGQREIARRTGVNQSHVSRRLALLRLPQRAQDDLAAGTLNIAEALTLAQVPREQQEEVYELARTTHMPVNSATASVRRRAEEALALEDARQQAEAEGVPVITPVQEWGREAYAHVLYSDDAISAAREAGTLRAAPTAHGLTYYATDPVRPASSGVTDSDGDRERRRANKARAEACAQLVQTCPPVQQLVADLARCVFRGRVTFADSLKRVHKWLGDQVGEQTTDHYAWHRSVAREGELVQTWVAWAMAVASDEGHATDAHTRWGPVEAAHLQRLIDGAGYVPTSWEQRRLAAAALATDHRGDGPADHDTEEEQP